jgi:hypothetical protein
MREESGDDFARDCFSSDDHLLMLITAPTRLDIIKTVFPHLCDWTFETEEVSAG